MKLVNGVG
jgi:hypothetical protein